MTAQTDAKYLFISGMLKPPGYFGVISGLFCVQVCIAYGLVPAVILFAAFNVGEIGLGLVRCVMEMGE